VAAASAPGLPNSAPSASYSHFPWQTGHMTMDLPRCPRDLIDIKSSHDPFLL
jgi:hypothetical protein